MPYGRAEGRLEDIETILELRFGDAGRQEDLILG
jgi:hypothetical protein